MRPRITRYAGAQHALEDRARRASERPPTRSRPPGGRRATFNQNAGFFFALS